MEKKEKAIELIKKLREMSGAGLSECKNALKEANDDLEIAFQLVTKKTMSLAEKRLAKQEFGKEQLIGCLVKDKKVCVLTLTAMTDFVIKNDVFIKTMKDIMEYLLTLEKTGDLKEFTEIDSVVLDLIKNSVAKLAESIRIKSVFVHKANEGNIFFYVHNMIKSITGGGIGTKVVWIETTCDPQTAEDLCLQILSEKPAFLSVDKIDQKTLEEQKQIFEKEVEEKNFKPEIKEKILSNKMEKFLQESCFLNKRFIFEEETEISVQNLLKSTNSQVFLFHREE